MKKNSKPFYIVVLSGRKYGAFWERKKAIEYKNKLEKRYKEKFDVVKM